MCHCWALIIQRDKFISEGAYCIFICSSVFTIYYFVKTQIHKYVGTRNCFTIFEHNLTIALMQYVEEIVQMYFIHIVTTYLYLCRDVESGEARGDVRSQNFRPCGIPAMYYYHVSKYIFDLLNRVCMYTVFLFSSNRDCIRKKMENCTLLLFVFYRSLKNIMP